MKICKCFAASLFAAFSFAATAASAFDHERLTTAEGRVYHEIFVLGSDAEGMTFRHREGIAKVGFPSLSAAYRMLYEAVEEIPASDPQGEGTRDAAGASGNEGAAASSAAGAPADGGEQVLQIAWFNRILVPQVPACRSFPVYGTFVPYGSWGPRLVGHDHRAAYPLGRAHVVREFLVLSGLHPFGCLP